MIRFLCIIVLVSGCASIEPVEDCNDAEKRLIGGWRFFSDKEKKEKETRFLESGRINTDPTLSCFESAYSVNYLGCHATDTTAVKYEHNSDPFLKVEKWKDGLEISETDFFKILKHAADVSKIRKVAPRRYIDISIYKNREWVLDEFVLPDLKKEPVEKNYRVATCRRQWRGEDLYTTSVIFIK